MVVGSIAAIANGATFPFFLAIFGSMNGIVATNGAQCRGGVGFGGGSGSGDASGSGSGASSGGSGPDDSLSAACNGTAALEEMGVQATFICYVGNAELCVCVICLVRSILRIAF